MTQFALKLVALIAMLLDHTAKVYLKSGILTPFFGMEMERQIRIGMMMIGRLAFPVFAWFVAEGCRRTSSPWKYLLRMVVFAVLSEIPFQLCFYRGLELGFHNVLFTMLLAVFGIFAGKYLQDRGMPAPVSQLLPALISVSLGWFLHTDYNAWGVALIVGLYYMPSDKGRLLYLGTWITVFQLIWHGWNGQTFSWLLGSGSIQILYWIGGLSAVALLATYNGERGKKRKWLFYMFYPCHLLIIYGITLI